jgi:hypothetical protein
MMRLRRGSRAELAEAHRIAVKPGEDVAIRLRLERDMRAQSGGNYGRRDA